MKELSFEEKLDDASAAFFVSPVFAAIAAINSALFI